jgi:hypothetical protein
MTDCFVGIVLIGGAVFLLVSILRWFEQTGDALDRGDWRKLLILLLFPLAVWFYPSPVSAGRPTPVPHHEPVRGFGKVPAMPSEISKPVDQPPPGTPAEFIGPPKIPPKKPKAPLDPEKLAKLRQKMKDQGMLDE